MDKRLTMTKKSLLRVPQICDNLFCFFAKTFGINWKKQFEKSSYQTSVVRGLLCSTFFSLFIFSSPPIIINKTFTIQLFSCWINAYPHSINITRSHVTWENALGLIAQCCDTTMLWRFFIQKIKIRIETKSQIKPWADLHAVDSPKKTNERVCVFLPWRVEKKKKCWFIF